MNFYLDCGPNLKGIISPFFRKILIKKFKEGFMKKIIVIFVAVFLSALSLFAIEGRVMRFPTITHGKIAFTYGGDIWIVGENGGTARRLTAHPGLELFPRFSPDGKYIAFTGQYDGHFEVYIMPSEGGTPRRLTYHGEIKTPERFGPDNLVMGWTPDGKRVLFRSRFKVVDTWFGKLYTVGLNGALPESLPLPYGGFASYSPDGKKIALNRIFRDFRTWKRYKGGMAQDIWIYNLNNYKLQRITNYVGSDRFPMWWKDKIFFLSDRSKRKSDGREILNLFYYDLKTGKIVQATNFQDYDINWPSLGDGKIVFEKGGRLFVYNIENGKVREIKVNIPTDRVWARPHWINVSKNLEEVDISPHGNRAVIVARGDIFSVPKKKGDTVNLTNSSNSREKYATWSPDGKWIAYISEKNGNQGIYIISKDGGKPIKITDGENVYKYQLIWSPDSKKIAWSDKNLKLWYVDIKEKKPVLVDKAKIWEIRSYAWSPDSSWLSYSKPEENRLSSIFLYSLKDKKIYRVTSKMTDDRNPYFDPKGRYLYFTSSRDYQPTLGHFEMSYTYNNMDRIYAVLLRSGIKNPMEPQNDKVKIKEKKKGEKKEEKFSIELKGISSRIVALKMKPGNLSGIMANETRIFYAEVPTEAMGGEEEGPIGAVLMAYDLTKKKPVRVISGIQGVSLSADGKNIIYRSGNTVGIIPSSTTNAKIGQGKVNLSNMESYVDPLAEWKEMFMEAWSLERDFFYAPNMHGVNWKGMIKRWGSLIPYISHRFDLNYIIGEMIGELSCSHTYVGGGDYPKFKHTNVGHLGADLEPDKATGYYRLKKILEGANWERKYRSPLREPGVKVKEGDYIIAIEGKQLRFPTNPYSLLQERAGKLTKLLVNSKPTKQGAWEINIIPIANDMSLRYYNWVLNNKRKVEKLSGGKIGYLHIPDMSLDGLNEFVKRYYAQINKQGLIIDVRFNGGGFVSQMILERLRRLLAAMEAPRNAEPGTYPDSVFHGYMACLVNHYSASDGDIFPYFFKYYKLGTLIGTRSWGGVVGIRGYRHLLDGGYITTPEFATYGLKGKWIIENHGADPDIVVDNDPGSVIKGRDPQLEKAVEILMKKIKKHPPKLPSRPKPPVK